MEKDNPNLNNKTEKIVVFVGDKIKYNSLPYLNFNARFI